MGRVRLPMTVALAKFPSKIVMKIAFGSNELIEVLNEGFAGQRRFHRRLRWPVKVPLDFPMKVPMKVSPVKVSSKLSMTTSLASEGLYAFR